MTSCVYCLGVRGSDDLADTWGCQVQEPLTGSNVCLRCACQAECVAPLVPSRMHEHHLVVRAVEIPQSWMTSVDEDDAKSRDPYAERMVELSVSPGRQAGLGGRDQQLIDTRAQRSIDNVVLSCADVLEKPSVFRRQVAPGEVGEDLGAL